jgi:hypothetical protein
MGGLFSDPILRGCRIMAGNLQCKRSPGYSIGAAGSVQYLKLDRCYYGLKQTVHEVSYSRLWPPALIRHAKTGNMVCSRFGFVPELPDLSVGFFPLTVIQCLIPEAGDGCSRWGKIGDAIDRRILTSAKYRKS